MSISEIIQLIKFARKSEGCVVLRDDLMLHTFGCRDERLESYEELIMRTRFKKDRI